jgi:pyridinium-3,5-bisthiocarboxylic acid mononucleotide nickel chelatase
LKIAYFDCYSGISGDMLIGSLMGAGCDFKKWLAQMETLPLEGWSASIRKVRRSGISGLKFSVKITSPQPQRSLPQIERTIKKSKLPASVKERAALVFNKLAQAEAAAHGVSVEKVHFHEVGAVDSIIDIAGTCLAVEMLKADKIFFSALNLGSGTVKAAHGVLPVPAPATAELIKGIPAYQSVFPAELTTPTGAALAATLSDGFGPMPPMEIKSTGSGAGDMDLSGMPNLLRVFIGEKDGGGYEEDSVVLVETNIDDMDPRVYEYIIERLLQAGALDAWLTPVIMKKSRPAVTLSALAEPGKKSAIIDIIMEETTTFGVRTTEYSRRKLAREFREVAAPGGKVRVKVGKRDGKILKAVPEYEDVKAAAKKSNLPLRDIIKLAGREDRKSSNGGGRGRKNSKERPVEPGRRQPD